MKAVLDTVVWVRGLMNPRSACGRAVSAAARYTNIMTPEILNELLTVIERPELEQKLTRISPRPAVERIAEAMAGVEFVHAPDEPSVSRDPADDKFFAAAVAGGAQYIVSEDNDVLEVGDYRGVRTVTAEQFLEILDAATS